MFEQLLDKSILEEPDKFEIRQIFYLLASEKQIIFLANWEKTERFLLKIREDLIKEQEILLGKALENIEQAISKAKRTGIKKGVTEAMGNLKRTL
ncbi:MAG: hypothetical protein PHR68_04255 [Candidatus Gracilibacteria bacterium]|nr:hypothetical protein [Candidatus Gracilibacteria bacterium]